MQNKSSINYYSKELDGIFQELNTGEHGLAKGEAKNRLLRYGANKLPETKADGLATIFFRQFQSPLIFILLLATVVVFLTGENTDGFVILFVLFFNAVVGMIQEGKAQNIFASLKNFIKTDASVIREGEEYIISDEEVVLGDIIILREGEKVPADARIIYSESLQADESALTGESNPKFKISETIKKTDVQISEQKNMVFKGTSIVAGSGKAIVIATGINTVIGNIAKKISTIDEELPLKKDVRRLSRFIIITVFAIAFVLLEIGIFYGHNLKEIFSTIVAISVSIIPEGLPIVVTLVLATGVWRMGKRNVLVKKLQAVEALGQTDIIALDKTGTITKNELVVKEAYVSGKLFSIKGIGYEPKGEIELNGKIIEPLNHPGLLMTGKIGALCSSAHLAFDESLKVWKISGDPTEAATLVFSEKMGFQKSDLEKEFIKIEEKPFDYQLKYHAILHKENGKYQLSVAGAPEEILDISEKIWSPSRTTILSSDEKEKLKNIFTRMSEKGLRVVALGRKQIEDERIPDKLSAIDFVGFLGIEDSPRVEVREAVEKVMSANIRLVMITGDHKVTARAIAKEAGIFRREDEIVEGKEIDEMTESDLANRLDNVSVFARVTPFHKLKIINAYKLAGKVVAMTGDGVNDALSLTSADVGVAMGKIGTEVAKEASDIILLDDNFGSIVSGVEEGRNIFKTIKRVILYLFSTSLGEVLTIIGAILLGLPLPILAAQILWLNLVTDGFLDVALAMEPKGDNLLGKKFTKNKLGFVDKLMVLRMFIMALPMAIGTLCLFSQNYQANLQKAWTISLTTLAVFQWFNVWNCRSQIKSIFTSNPFSNKFLVGATGIVIGLQLLAVYNPFLQKVLRTVPLSGKDWLVIVTVAFSIVIIEELRKVAYRRK
ncbi:MAG TPA: HAD-IC family P-type ATPase [Candidatus Moranbacteria bacterium]|nr:HAD-IC family P-type ATPase [Candidatus Moranbacteria bacterium]